MIKDKSFLWRKINEKEKEQIRKQAKSIMDDFAAALRKAKHSKDFHALEREQQTREEKGVKNQKEFRKRFLKQAPKTDGDWIVAEKGKWKVQ